MFELQASSLEFEFRAAAAIRRLRANELGASFARLVVVAAAGSALAQLILAACLVELSSSGSERAKKFQSGLQETRYLLELDSGEKELDHNCKLTKPSIGLTRAQKKTTRKRNRTVIQRTRSSFSLARPELEQANFINHRCSASV